MVPECDTLRARVLPFAENGSLGAHREAEVPMVPAVHLESSEPERQVRRKGCTSWLCLHLSPLLLMSAFAVSAVLGCTAHPESRAQAGASSEIVSNTPSAPQAAYTTPVLGIPRKSLLLLEDAILCVQGLTGLDHCQIKVLSVEPARFWEAGSAVVTHDQFQTRRLTGYVIKLEGLGKVFTFQAWGNHLHLVDVTE